MWKSNALLMMLSGDKGKKPTKELNMCSTFIEIYQSINMDIFGSPDNTLDLVLGMRNRGWKEQLEFQGLEGALPHCHFQTTSF